MNSTACSTSSRLVFQARALRFWAQVSLLESEEGGQEQVQGASMAGGSGRQSAGVARRQEVRCL